MTGDLTTEQQIVMLEYPFQIHTDSNFRIITVALLLYQHASTEQRQVVVSKVFIFLIHKKKAVL